MTIGKLETKIRQALMPLYGIDEAKTVSRRAMEFIFNCDSKFLLLNKEREVSKADSARAEKILTRLASYEPLQYITGTTEFYGRPFVVTPDVLIPRPETEELVDRIVKDVRISVNHKPRILDIGTGSGCIAVALKAELNFCSISAIDVSIKAIVIARVNAKQNKARVSFSILDILREIPKGNFDIIVSNPPYISNHEKSGIGKNVSGYEPHIALFVEGKNPLLFYERIAELAKNGLLKERGCLYFEINQEYGNEIAAMLKGMKFSKVELMRDMSANNRMLKCVNN